MERQPAPLRVEDAALDVAARLTSELDIVALLADVCQSRRTTAMRLISALDARGRITRRDWLAGVLRDIADGTHSVLEHGYLTKVERPHGLPRAIRQPRSKVGPTRYRDVLYPEYGQAFELDSPLLPRLRRCPRRGPRP